MLEFRLDFSAALLAAKALAAAAGIELLLRFVESDCRVELLMPPALALPSEVPLENTSTLASTSMGSSPAASLKGGARVLPMGTGVSLSSSSRVIMSLGENSSLSFSLSALEDGDTGLPSLLW